MIYSIEHPNEFDAEEVMIDLELNIFLFQDIVLELPDLITSAIFQTFFGFSGPVFYFWN